MNIKQKMDNLRHKIDNWNYQYYVLTHPTVSDFEFDQKLKELEMLEAKYPEYYDYYSPTRRIGSDVNNNFIQKNHIYPMLSLSNTYSKKEVNDFYNRTKKILNENFIIVCELKYDGISISLIYQNGLLLHAITRGDGTTGDDVTANIRMIKSIPLKLQSNDYPVFFEVRGEIILPWASFNEINEEKIKNGEIPFTNPRNAAAGTLKTLNPQVVSKRNLDACLYHLLGDNLPSGSHYENLKFAQSWGFKVSNVTKCCQTIDEVFTFINHWGNERKKLPFATDGVVLKVDSIRQQSLLGLRAKSPRWAIAYKFQTEAVKTILHSVDFQVGKTGIITPVANLEPVLLSGTTIKRASLHNESIINTLDLYIGDQCSVEKGGEIIPKITGINKEARLLIGVESSKVRFPTNCPACGTLLIRFSNEVAYYCPNHVQCEPQIKGMIIHFMSRKAMNINAGEEAIKSFYKAGLVHSIADLYEIKRDDILRLERWAEKSAVNFIESVKKSKQVPYERVLYGLGIRFVGEAIAKKIAKAFPTIEQLSTANNEQLTSIDEVGDRIAQSVVQYFSNENNFRLIKRLKFHGLQLSTIQKISISNSNRLTSKAFVISGTFRRYSRSKYKELIENNGGRNMSSPSAKTDFILIGDNIGISKLKKAQRLGIKTISEDEFLKMVDIV